MKLTLTILALIGLAAANPRPQLPTPDMPPPPLSSQVPPDDEQTPEPTTTSTSTSTSRDNLPSDPTRAPPVPDGAICECGYTYCASVLMGMKKPWSQKELSEAYCSTPNASCDKNVPATNISSALYICLCDDPDQKVGTNLDLVCGCDKCLNIGPDFRGRCETPCHAGNCQMRLW
ncbi:SSCRP protein [Trichoderma parareesei]|uniref:SSCRP protein n=1 Tax=Trichoderma parareesei TaxID=858221 RepID=A0A2H2ZDL3_TRIPA|nr:SSCRP protein [Trichoderma parareesei]